MGVTLKTILFSAGLISAVSLNCSPTRLGVYRGKAEIHDQGTYSYDCNANKETIDGLLSDVWHSGFLEQSEAIKEEILNNKYGVYDECSGYNPCGKNAQACFLKEITRRGGLVIKITETLMMNRNLFCHLEFDRKGKTTAKGMDKRASAALLHELFHDFWHNILNPDTKLLFSMESEIWYRNLKNAEDIKDQNLYMKLKEKRKYYTDEKFFGTELYSTIADRVFSGEITMPKQLSRFYRGFISEEALSKDKL